jgi:hypothetical protein
MKHQKIVITVLSFLLYYSVLAQPKDIQRVIGPSPNVASLFKFNDQPISLFTGTPSIEIPVYTIKSGSLELPITLMYHASGVKVTENASWTGLGWALNAGGAITSSIYGLSDIDFPRRTQTTFTKCELTGLLNSQLESQPDLFFFNFLNQSGKFYINDNQQIFQIPYTKIKIESIVDPVVGKTWKITNTDGNIFIFNKIEETISTRQTSITNSGTIVPNTHPDISSKTWFLTKIISPIGDSIMLNYESYTSVCQYFKSETNYFQASGAVLNACGSGPTVPVPPNTSNYEFQRITGFRLKSIIAKNVSVQFITGGSRCDLLGDRYLSEIDVADNTGNIIKKMALNYKYLIGNTLTDLPQVDCSSETFPSVANVDKTLPSLSRRLMLMGVDELNPISNDIGNSYKLNYETSIGLPSKFSAQQDLWGYYNGNGQTSLLQNLQQSSDNLGGITIPIVTGRDANLQYAKQGTLTQITYPTGGNSSFTYELNDVRQYSSTGCGSTIVIADASYTLQANVDNQLIGTFTVNHCQGGASLTFKINGCAFATATNPLTVLPYGFYIKKNGTTIFSSNDVILQSNGNTSGGISYYLDNGTYSIYSFSTSGPNCAYTLTIPGRQEPQFISTSNLNQITLGGLRINKIIHFDPVTNTGITKNYDYRINKNGILASSGVEALANNHLVYTNCFLTSRDLLCSSYPGATESSIVPLMTLNSNTNYPLTLTHGSAVGYEQVTEKKTDINGNDIGKTIYTFSTPGDQIFQNITNLPNDFNNSAPNTSDFYPFAPNYSYDWERGLLLKKEDYKNLNNGNYSIVSRDQNIYSSPILMDITHGTVAAYYLNSQMPYTNNCTGYGSYNTYSIFKYNNYLIYSQYVTLNSTVHEDFDNSLNETKTVTNYSYNSNNLLPSIQETVNSKNEYLISNTKYPLDFTLSGTATNTIAQGIQNLQNQKIITPVVEKYVQKSNLDGSNLRTVSATLNTFKQNVPLPDKIYKWEALAGTSFTPSVINSTTAAIDGNYQPKVSFNQYDAFGNILEQQKINDIKEVYLWGYNAQYPVAKIIGSDNATVNGIITQSQIDAATSSDGNLRTVLNTLRTGLPNALITTYTYKPLVGMTSQTDPKGMTTYYNYDSFNRLAQVLDNKSNILKDYTYHYFNQSAPQQSFSETIAFDQYTTISQIGSCSITFRDAGTNAILLTKLSSKTNFLYTTSLPASSNGYYTVTVVPDPSYPLEVFVNNVMKDVSSTQTWSQVSGSISIIVSSNFY